MKKVILITVLLTACTAPPSPSPIKTPITVESISKELAKRDKSTDYEIYKKEFQTLKSACKEDDIKLAGMVVSITKRMKKQDEWASNLDTLKSFNVSTTTFKRKPGKCMDIYLYYWGSDKE